MSEGESTVAGGGMQRFVRDEDGVTAVEYGGILGVMSAVVVFAMHVAGDNLADVYREVAAVLGNLPT